MRLTDDDIFAMAPFARTLGVRFPAIDTAEVRAELDLAPPLSTMGGGLHGGAIMSLCDLAAAVLVGLNLPDGSDWTTVESHTHFLSPVLDRTANAVAQPLKLGRTVLSVEVTVTDAAGVLCARTSQLLITRRRTPESSRED
ncbi:Thioesterase superfamily protein OS=Tsukamurella paurometabola (strain ATCC 8368 / DSM / CCUG 35730 / CIP 100753 / JCM 10117 / KCTC 9821 / NBRC 16120 /NCIMB 702349 / NCTC 13040) OX=521096 GN=Tpau_3502 PE=3 SV=1 [Tsukamurella paurometabola]|uniref:Thioesterase superfamily protein n=1 Tax=Tsukamurella paurometabola (strain ATCC 8368 / DSM 20162 / CCUG 35730 / CIP 100753 / JCM 10117 / KCTC 9821 / NBRC 16120 / NCIMB 702349 / NCTC 13040) TaxID=521096 RepID=D5UX62_TSUPD|nr:PaaI family thioesterase [Tsukamurella paurometabola]ADG80081.1 thioesterase superfamily protein [Tsukamurella paurometabola DSM 20162]SUP38343.1 Putative esterase Rv1847/MT1895 [Tsukamurella paurometabola]